MSKSTTRHPANWARKPWLMLVVLLLLLAFGASLLLRERRPEVASLTTAGPPPTVGVPAIPESGFLNVAPHVAYVGSEQCRKCHADAYASYRQTAHSRSLAEVNPAVEPPDAVFDHERSGRRYVVYRKDGILHHRELIRLPDDVEISTADYPLKYLIGSGRYSRTYAAEAGEFLVESPLTWYASLNAWAMSPGYDAPDHESFHRAVGFDCLFCHAGNIESHPRSVERVTLHELAIGCERCHGPGELHVVERSEQGASRARETDLTIVNPAKLTRELTEAICQQCHLDSVVRVAVRGRSRGRFRPGLPWDAFYVNYEFQQREAMTVTGHVGQLRLSRCYQESTTLTCVTCHDPHATAPNKNAASYRNTCLQCHKVNSCTAADASRTANADNCAVCHMPPSGTEIPHIAFTHHRIGIHEPPVAAPEPPAIDFELSPVLTHFQQSPIETQRMLGLAYTELFRSASEPAVRQAFYERAARSLEAAYAGGIMDSAVCAALAELASATGDATGTEKYGAAALSRETGFVETHLRPTELLAQLHLRNGRTQEAIEALRTLTDSRLYPADWFLLGIAYQRLSRLDEAIGCCEQVIALDGGQPEPHEMLSAIHSSRGEPRQADEHTARARQLRRHRSALNARSLDSNAER